MKDDRLYLGHVLEAIDDIQRSAEAGHDAFLAERMRQDAIIRKFEVIGEAVKNISEAVKRDHPETRWRRIAGMRDRLTHAYFGVDLALVWAVVERELPSLRETIEQLLAVSPPETG